MHYRRLIAKTAGGCAGVAAFLCAGATLAAAAADAPTLSACRASYARANEQENTGHLRAARDALSECAKASCGELLHRQCLSGYTRLDRKDIPSVVVRVNDSAGNPVTDVEVTVDGELVASHLDGRSFPLDPGLHEFSFSTHGETFGAQKVLLAEGEHHHIVSAAIRAAPVRHSPEAAASGRAPDAAHTVAPDAAHTVAPDAAPDAAHNVALAPPPEPIRPDHSKEETHSPLPFVFAAGGVLGVTAGAATFAFAKKDDAQSIGVDISVGVGVAAVVIVGWFITSHGKPSRTTADGVTLKPVGAALPWLSGSF